MAENSDDICAFIFDLNETRLKQNHIREMENSSAAQKSRIGINNDAIMHLFNEIESEMRKFVQHSENWRVTGTDVWTDARDDNEI